MVSTMQFIYQNAFLPLNKELMEEINDAATGLHNKLLEINVAKLGISKYNQRYLGSYLANLRSTLQKYAFIIAWSVAGTAIPKEKRVFVDYGGGSGILSLLAKEFEFGTVIYNDIYDVSCRDAKIIGLNIGNQADHYILGDIDDVTVQLRNKGIKCNSIVSYDVIEHIYDMESFVRKLPQIADENDSVIVMASSANSCNPMINHNLKKVHYTAEFEDKKEYFGRKKRDSSESYYQIRKRIIQSHIAHASHEEIEELTKRTRGMIESEITRLVHDYSENKKFPPKPKHPTNTCDPYTGNWAEHLMDIYQLAGQLANVGFDSKILAGYYGNSNSKLNILPKLNVLIGSLRKYGIYIAPFFVLYGKMSGRPKSAIP